MKTLPTTPPDFPRRIHFGRPRSEIRKVSISVRIPLEIDKFLNSYCDAHEVLKGEVIAEALIWFRINKAAKTNPEAVAILME